MRPAHPNGFTLTELLIAIAAILLVMTLIVPRLERQSIQADESNAIAALKTLNQMQGQYTALYPTRGFACSLAKLGGNPKTGVPSADAAQLIPDDLARGSKAGYRYTLSGCETGFAGDVHSYAITAVPERPGKTGDRGFCTDNSGAITFDPRGGANCTDKLQ